MGHQPAASAFNGPVLIIRGGADTFVTEQLVNAVSPRFAEADVKVIDTGGHWVHLEYPGVVAAMILDFSDTIAGATPSSCSAGNYHHFGDRAQHSREDVPSHVRAIPCGGSPRLNSVVSQTNSGKIVFWPSGQPTNFTTVVSRLSLATL
jgi:hypothetical protein